MHRLSSKKVAIAISATLAVSGIGCFLSQADNKVYVDADVSVTSAIERYIASNSDISAIEIAEDKGDDSDKSSVQPATGTDATGTDAQNPDSTQADEPVSTVKYPEYEGKAVVTTADNVNIRAAGDIEAEVVGLIASGGVMNVMDKGEEWSLIASGDVIGYINNDFIAFGDEGAEYAYNNVYKVAVVTTTTLKVREEPSTESECSTLIPLGEKYLLLEQLDGWVYIEVDDSLSGYVSDEYIDIVPASIYARPITEFAEPSDDVSDDDYNDDSYNDNSDYNDNDDSYDDNSDYNDNDDNSDDGYSDNENGNDGHNDTDDGNSNDDGNDNNDDGNDKPEVGESGSYSSAGVDVANFAVQFVGNPYVYGGSSLTNGADCSGFTMAVYAHFGISLPHGATMQSRCGTEVSLSALQPGDLVMYDHGTGSIEHVGLYIGGDQIVHASSSTTGIIISSVNYSTPFKAVRLLN